MAVRGPVDVFDKREDLDACEVMTWRTASRGATGTPPRPVPLHGHQRDLRGRLAGRQGSRRSSCRCRPPTSTGTWSPPAARSTRLHAAVARPGHGHRAGPAAVAGTDRSRASAPLPRTSGRSAPSPARPGRRWPARNGVRWGLLQGALTDQRDRQGRRPTSWSAVSPTCSSAARRCSSSACRSGRADQDHHRPGTT